jgi:heparan-alpha-glucosaminide N-acetyltransferase
MKNRIASIDIFRALTMLLMIFVNDLWTLDNIPGWLEHTAATDDGMGLADVVFPAFLFIVGLSIPFAMKARANHGDTRARIFVHILRRSLALIVMGFFMVNHENYRSDIPQLTRTAWEIFMILAFVLIWNSYEKEKVRGIPVWLLQAAGVVILVLLALLYKGGTPAEPEWMTPHWWGILGLIGWAYLLNSLLYLVTGNRLWLIVASCLILHALNAQEFLPFSGSGRGFRLIVSASNHALVASGVMTTAIFMQLRNNTRKFAFPVVMTLTALVFVCYGFTVRPLWGISKILATPAWTAICAGISMAVFSLIYVISDIFHTARWAGVIMPAGRSTLTCYLLPGLVYPFLWPLQQLMPPAFLEGWIGILKSLLFALLIVVLTGLLEKIKIHLKI